METLNIILFQIYDAWIQHLVEFLNWRYVTLHILSSSRSYNSLYSWTFNLCNNQNLCILYILYIRGNMKLLILFCIVKRKLKSNFISLSMDWQKGNRFNNQLCLLIWKGYTLLWRFMQTYTIIWLYLFIQHGNLCI